MRKSIGPSYKAEEGKPTITYEQALRMLGLDPEEWEDVEDRSKKALVRCISSFTQGGKVPLKVQDANRIRYEFEMFA